MCVYIYIYIYNYTHKQIKFVLKGYLPADEGRSPNLSTWDSSLCGFTTWFGTRAFRRAPRSPGERGSELLY